MAISDVRKGQIGFFSPAFFAWGITRNLFEKVQERTNLLSIQPFRSLWFLYFYFFLQVPDKIPGRIFFIKLTASFQLISFFFFFRKRLIFQTEKFNFQKIFLRWIQCPLLLFLSFIYGSFPPIFFPFFLFNMFFLYFLICSFFFFCFLLLFLFSNFFLSYKKNFFFLRFKKQKKNDFFYFILFLAQLSFPSVFSKLYLWFYLFSL